MVKTELQTEWERRIAIFKESGQTQAKWCADNNLKLHQFKYWLKRLKGSSAKQKPKTKWTSVEIEETVEERNETLQIKIGEAAIEVKPGFNPAFLADVVRTLTTLC